MTTVTSDVVDGGLCQQRASSARLPSIGFLTWRNATDRRWVVTKCHSPPRRRC